MRQASGGWKQRGRRSRVRAWITTLTVIGVVGVSVGLTSGADWMNLSSSGAPVVEKNASLMTVALALPAKASVETNGVSAGENPSSPGAAAESVAFPLDENPPGSLTGEEERANAARNEPAKLAGPKEENLTWGEVTVRPGDSLFTIFRDHDVPVRFIKSLAASASGGNLSSLRPGQTIRIGKRPDDEFAALDLEFGGKRVRFLRNGETFEATSLPKQLISLANSATDLETGDAETANDAAANRVSPSTEKATEVEVRRGDSFYVLFKRLGFSESDFASLLGDSKLKAELTRIRPKQKFTFYTDEGGTLQRLVYAIDAVNSLEVNRVDGRFVGSYRQAELERRVATASGVIKSSLFLSGQAAGLPDSLIMEMANIFSWDIDFALDIRPGDRFTVLYEELYSAGKKVKDGALLAAEFVNRDRSVRAVRFQRDDGKTSYFTPQGLSLRTAFLRAPMKFTRVSSGFNLKRLHPVLGTVRAHRGIDYAAPRGTPITATGDGKVAFVGRKGGYGKTIILRHGGTYTTLYAHMNGFARGMREGVNVRQGQVIGYVGSTGIATGPHLHYEFRVNGVYKNPATVSLPKAAPIDPRQKPAFIAQTRGLLAQLDLLSKTQIASSSQ